MKRREFLGKAALASAVVLADETAKISTTKHDETDQNLTAKCRVTVIKRAAFPELAKKYQNEEASPCPDFKDGQEFIISNPYRHPENFCHWAWADIRPTLGQIYFGGGSEIVCCTDGTRPVFFYLERIEK
ncbi:TIGR04076 family protein [candidate division KSB1 bacterium]